jgi:hypothetical protein
MSWPDIWDDWHLSLKFETAQLLIPNIGPRATFASELLEENDMTDSALLNKY